MSTNIEYAHLKNCQIAIYLNSLYRLLLNANNINDHLNYMSKQKRQIYRNKNKLIYLEVHVNLLRHKNLSCIKIYGIVSIEGIIYLRIWKREMGYDWCINVILQLPNFCWADCSNDVALKSLWKPLGSNTIMSYRLKDNWP